jgi:hypothetical protein
VVKKVLRKGVRDRVRKLGLDHQKEVSGRGGSFYYFRMICSEY